MPANPNPHGVAPGETGVHSAYYSMWWNMYVKSAGNALDAKRIVQRAAAMRAHRLAHPRLR